MKQKKPFRRLKKYLSLHLHFIHFLVLLIELFVMPANSFTFEILKVSICWSGFLINK